MAFKGALLCGQVSRSAETVKIHRLLRDGYASEEQFRAAVAKEEELIVQLQKGFAFVSGGQTGWLDILRPIAASFSGFQSSKDSIGPVTRWFRTNTFYRKPHLAGRLSCEGGEIAGALTEVGGNGIVFLPGPYSFLRLVENSYYKDSDGFCADYAEAISVSIPQLQKRGYSCALFLEPFVGYDLSRNQLENFKMEKFFDAIKAENFAIGVHFPLADASLAIPMVENTSVDFIGVDAIHSQRDKIATGKDIIIGLVDGARIGVESPDYIAREAKVFTEEADFSGNYYIAPNDRLWDVPFDAGLQKISALAAVASILGDS